MNRGNNKQIRAGALVWWLWEETHVRKVVGLNPGTVYWMNIFTHIFVVNICNVCYKRLKINEKEAGIGPFLIKISKLYTFISVYMKMPICAHVPGWSLRSA